MMQLCGGAAVNVRVVGAGKTAEHVRAALARVGLQERAGTPTAFVCGLDDLARAIAMRELSQAYGPIVVQKEHFRALAQTDGLTGLPNFRSFHARLEEEVARAHRYGHPLACAMVDLDGLKEINDRLGHAAGNAGPSAWRR